MVLPMFSHPLPYPLNTPNIYSTWVITKKCSASPILFKNPFTNRCWLSRGIIKILVQAVILPGLQRTIGCIATILPQCTGI